MAQGLKPLAVMVICLSVGLHIGKAFAGPLWQEEAQRLQVGLKVFPAVLGALTALEGRRSSDGSLEVIVVHEGSDETARQAALDLRAIGQVRGLPLSVEVLEATALDKLRAAPLGGIFVASVGISARRLSAWSERLQTLVFSPFAGDVEAGAVAGIHVTDQILPFVNLKQARRAGVEFKPFLLQVARRHE